MSMCPQNQACPFHAEVEPSVLKRVKYASAYAYCRGGRFSECALYSRLSRSEPVEQNLLPDGGIGDWAEAEHSRVRHRFLIIEDSPVFAALASATVASHYSDAEIVRHLSYSDAEADVQAGGFSAIICGYGLGDGRTANDVRVLTRAPIVVFTGRLDGVRPPVGAKVVEKSAGPDALIAAVRASLA